MIRKNTRQARFLRVGLSKDIFPHDLGPGNKHNFVLLVNTYLFDGHTTPQYFSGVAYSKGVRKNVEQLKWHGLLREPGDGGKAPAGEFCVQDERRTFPDPVFARGSPNFSPTSGCSGKEVQTLRRPSQQFVRNKPGAELSSPGLSVQQLLNDFEIRIYGS